ncbi:ABC transporter B family member 14 [Cardamine amara subsp. amara]|uniref:ABC transporter B family member 14 n=1 Tax=Cardamine amara subsp. amara TaxID=228776 RepID=A0ABD1BNF0_CARAN
MLPLSKSSKYRIELLIISLTYVNNLAFCSYALGLRYISVLVKREETNFEDSIKSFMVLLVTAYSVAETLALTPDIVKGTQALGSVFRVLHRKTEIPPDQPGSRLVTRIKGDIEFRNVSFAYPTRPEIAVFQNLSLRILAREKSCGRRTRWFGKEHGDRTDHEILRSEQRKSRIDGQDIKILNLRSLRKKLALVRARTSSFSTSIHENIKYGNENASEARDHRSRESCERTRVHHQDGRSVQDARG